MVQGTKVTVVLSLGPEPEVKILDNLVLMDVESAKTYLDRMGMNPLVKYEFSDVVAKGSVIVVYGGYEDAERRMLIFLPDYLEADSLYDEDSPLVCLRATFFEEDSLSHRDFLGALMGAGIARETVGDICVGKGCCDFFVTAEIAPYILQNFLSAGRTRIHLSAVPLQDAQIPEPEVKEIKDTVASLRLDSIVSSGFRIGRSLAAQYICAGKAAIDGLPCEKPDKTVAEGMKISIRGLGKIKLQAVNGRTKKDRISVLIHRYV